MFTSPTMINALNVIVDEAVKLPMTPDQATILASRENIVALVTTLVETYKAQGMGDTIVLSPMFIHGLIDMGIWMGDRLDVSLLGNEV